MKCSYCGANVPSELKYCLNCGTELKRETETSRPEWPEQVWDLGQDRAGEPFAPEEKKIPKESVFLNEVQVAAAPKPVHTAPCLQLPTKRGLGKMFFLGILTLGIYPTVIWSRIVAELNIAASPHDGKRTMSYFGMCMLAPITLGIQPLVWIHKFCNRIGGELKRRGIDYKFGASAFWLWNVLGTLILVGPFIFVHKLMKAMNLINMDFNRRG